MVYMKAIQQSKCLNCFINYLDFYKLGMCDPCTHCGKPKNSRYLDAEC